MGKQTKSFLYSPWRQTGRRLGRGSDRWDIVIGRCLSHGNLTPPPFQPCCVSGPSQQQKPQAREPSGCISGMLRISLRRRCWSHFAFVKAIIRKGSAMCALWGSVIRLLTVGECAPVSLESSSRNSLSHSFPPCALSITAISYRISSQKTGCVSQRPEAQP